MVKSYGWGGVGGPWDSSDSPSLRVWGIRDRACQKMPKGVPNRGLSQVNLLLAKLLKLKEQTLHLRSFCEFFNVLVFCVFQTEMCSLHPISAPYDFSRGHYWNHVLRKMLPNVLHTMEKGVNSQFLSGWTLVLHDSVQSIPSRHDILMMFDEVALKFATLTFFH